MIFPRRLAVAALLGASLVLLGRASEAAPQSVVFGVHAKCDEIAFSRNGRVLMTRDGTLFPSPQPQIRFWNVTSRRLIRTVPGGLLERISGDGGRFLVLNRERRGAVGFVDCVAPSPNARVALKWSAPKNEDIFDADWSKDGKEIWLLSSKKLLRFSASTGALLCSTTRDPRVHEWLAQDGQRLLAISASPSNSKEARLTQLDIISGTSKLLVARLSPEFSLNRVSPDFQFFVVTDFDTRGQIFRRLRDNKRLWMWENHTSSSAFSPDSRFVVSFDKERNLCLARDARTGAPLWQIKGPRPLVFAFSPDGKTLAEARHDGQILLWPLPPRS